MDVLKASRLLLIFVSAPAFASHLERTCSNPAGDLRGDGTNWTFHDQKLVGIKTDTQRRLPVDLGKDLVFDIPSYEIWLVKLSNAKSQVLITEDYVFCHAIGSPAQ